MDRITIRGDHGVFLEPHWDFCIDPNDYDLLQQILGRLAIFEDLLEDQDMEPEEFVAAFKSAFTEDSLLKLTAGYLGTTPDCLREQAQADKDGRLVVLPCKVGDYVYVPCIEGKKVVQVRVQGISVSVSGRTILRFGGYPFESAWGDGCGTAWFLTSEDAEKSLVEKDGGDADG